MLRAAEPAFQSRGNQGAHLVIFTEGVWAELAEGDGSTAALLALVPRAFPLSCGGAGTGKRAPLVPVLLTHAKPKFPPSALTGHRIQWTPTPNFGQTSVGMYHRLWLRAAAQTQRQRSQLPAPGNQGRETNPRWPAPTPHSQSSH